MTRFTLWAGRVRIVSILLAGAFFFVSGGGVPALADDERFGLTNAAFLGLALLTLIVSFFPRIAPGYLLVVASVSLSIIVLELALRPLLGPKYYSPFELHDEFIYTLTAGAVREFQHMTVNGGHRVVYRVNTDGFRGPELREHRNTYRIVVYGDSFIQAEFSTLENTFAYQLESYLSDHIGRPIEVINAGVAGYGPDQILRRIQAEIPGLSPDLVIVSVFSGNDFGDLVRNKLYRLDDSGALVPNEYRLSGEILRNMSLNRREPILKKIARRGRDAIKERLSSALDQDARDPVRVIRQALEQVQDEYYEFVIAGDDIVRELASDPYNADVALLPDSESARYKVAKMEAVIGEITAVVRDRGVPTLGLVIPHPMDLLNGSHASGVIERSEYPQYDGRRLTDHVSSMFQARGLGVVNLYQAFQESDVESFFLKGGDDHWSDIGQAAAAKIVGEYIIANWLEE